MSNEGYKEFVKCFDEYFSLVKNSLPAQPVNLYEPARYFLNLDGKRLRPLLVLIAADCFNGDMNKGLPAAASVELFHNFSLIHDDIMDNAPLRRGNKTVHEKWNSNIAILSGDVLLVKAYREIAKCNNSEVADIFSKTAIEVCEGQQYDMDFEGMSEVTVEQYLEMIKLKTAVLLAASLQMGALCAGAPTKNAEGFYAAGLHLGMAFQLTDDYLDTFGIAKKTGKQEGGDIIANKKTWLFIKANELSNATQKSILQEWCNKKDFNPVEKVNAVKSVFTELKLNTLLESEIENYYSKAFALISNTCPENKKAEAFIAFIKTLMKREK